MPRSMLVCTLAVLFGLLVCSRAARAQIYTWHDENGIVVLSDRPRGDDVQTFAAFGTETIRTTRAGSASPGLRRFEQQIQRQASRFGVRPDLVRAVIQVESGFDPNARSAKGAMGLMQLMPDTASALGVRNAYDPEQNIRAGVAYLRQLLDRYEENETLALAAYNAGPGAVSRHGNQIPPFAETQAYVEEVRATTAIDDAPETNATIYKTYEAVNGRRVPVYTNIPPASDDFEIAGRK